MRPSRHPACPTVDANHNGVLNKNEVAASVEICHGADALEGTDADGGCAAAGAGSLALLAVALRRRRG